MDLSLTETQQLIRDSARDVVHNDFAKEVLLTLDEQPAPMTDALWRKTAQLGWMGMVIPEAYGGTGNSLTDVAVLFEELGRGSTSTVRRGVLRLPGDGSWNVAVIWRKRRGLTARRSLSTACGHRPDRHWPP